MLWSDLRVISLKLDRAISIITAGESQGYRLSPDTENLGRMLIQISAVFSVINSLEVKLNLTLQSSNKSLLETKLK